jgi:hypothetical protein
MALETGTYISDLVPTNPSAGDLISAGDDHIRLLKSTIKATFPNLTGAVAATHTELGYLSGVSSNVQTQLDAKAALSHTHSEADITDGNVFPRLAATEVIPGSWNFTTRPQVNGNGVLDSASSIPETNIADGSILARLAANETVAGNWNFTGSPLIGGLGPFRWATAGLTSGRAYLTNVLPADTGTPGDIYFVY